MKEIKSIGPMRQFAALARQQGKTIGFVPTMGALHEGHLSLVEAARKTCDIVVVSIFVNPAQFGPKEDYKKYPRDLNRDRKFLNVDVLFLPQPREMYPDDFKTFTEVEDLSSILCGASRPGHFKGVATVVLKLFNIIKPDRAFFGEKDYQQLIIIKKMVKDLNLPVEIVSLPTVREFDGLAMSSRNAYLSAADRKIAAHLYQALLMAKKEIKKGQRNSRKVISRLRSHLARFRRIRLDYAVVVDPQTLEKVERIKGKVVVALAAYLGKTRLIDNLTVVP